MLIEVFGPGCPACKLAGERVRQAVQESGFKAIVQEVHDINVIMGRGVVSTPSIFVDGQVMSKGRAPRVEEIKAWLQPPAANK
jgi:small redox-active disulfide protein 2